MEGEPRRKDIRSLISKLLRKKANGTKKSNVGKGKRVIINSNASYFPDKRF